MYNRVNFLINLIQRYQIWFPVILVVEYPCYLLSGMVSDAWVDGFVSSEFSIIWLHEETISTTANIKKHFLNFSHIEIPLN